MWGSAGIYENLNLTYNGWGFTVAFVVDVNFVIDNGTISVWANGSTWDSLWIAGIDEYSYSGSFSATTR